MLGIKRTYDAPAHGDGRRILVERLWPRGMKKEAVAADAWMKEVAPSTQLRQWFDHRVERWEEFRRRYRKELAAHPDAWEPILDADPFYNRNLSLESQHELAFPPREGGDKLHHLTSFLREEWAHLAPYDRTQALPSEGRVRAAGSLVGPRQ